MPPALGYFTVRAPTETASGETKKMAPRRKRAMEPGPACAAAAIHRVPIMHEIANSVMSRRPSSRRRVVAGVRLPEYPTMEVMSITSGQRERLTAIRLILLDLHKALLDLEREYYEKDHGEIKTPGEYLQ